MSPAAGGTVSVADAPNPGVDLVAFDAQAPVKPISPGVVPDGWSVDGSEYALVIAPPGNDTSADDFRGKLVVYVDANNIPHESLSTKVEVAVGDRTGYAIRADDSGLQVWVPQADGTGLRAQAPLSLRLGRGHPRAVPRCGDGQRRRGGRRRLTAEAQTAERKVLR